MISAKIVADSISKHGSRMTTFELEYPRFIHSEFMTHRMLSKNSSSSRAIPIKKMHEMILENNSMPIHWGKNQAGMQANTEVDIDSSHRGKKLWEAARDCAIHYAGSLENLGIHKQIVNRITEPFQTMKVVCSGTEWANFLWLRNHKDAQPEIKELAQHVEIALTTNNPERLNFGDWHLPYVTLKKVGTEVTYWIDSETEITLETAKMVSASCCAQVSYRKNDISLEKATQIFDRLIKSEPIHASPIEHQATPMEDYHQEWEPGMTHVDRYGVRWSGNLREWIQWRQLIPNHVRW